MVSTVVDNLAYSPRIDSYSRNKPIPGVFLFRQYWNMLKAGAMSWLDNPTRCSASESVLHRATVKKSKFRQHASPAGYTCGLSDPKRPMTGDETK